jgi:archaemetzincin
MKIRIAIVVLFVIFLLIVGYGRIHKTDEEDKNDEVDKADEAHATTLRAAIKILEPLHHVPDKPKSNDWLANHEESGQSFEEYLKSRPIRPTTKRNKLYVVPLGTFDKRASEIIADSATFMSLYFQIPVVLMKTESLEQVPDYAKRVSSNEGNKQLLSTWVLDKFLKPQLPDDALAMIAFTSIDLWPGKGWNFVFGQASLRGRVGVWSIARNGDPNIDEKGYVQCLTRTLKTATHETGHMLSIVHCTAWRCNMAGSNNLEESDRQPLYLCPECVSKVCWATRSDINKRYAELLSFAQKHELSESADFYMRAINSLKSKE